MKKITLKLMTVAISASLLFVACEKGESGIDSNTATRIASLEQQAETLQKALDALKTASDTMSSELKSSLDKRYDELNTKYDDLYEQIKTIDGFEDLTELLERMQALENRQDDVDNSLEMTASLATSIGALNDHIAAINNALDGKVDQATYNAFVRTTNEQITKNSENLLELYGYCTEFIGGDQTIKQYIDKSVDEVQKTLTEAMGNYVLKSTYDAFYNSYQQFQSSTNNQIAQNQADIKALENLVKDLFNNSNPDASLDEILGLEKTVAEMKVKLDNLESSAVTLDILRQQFSKENADFAAGVNGVIEEALSENGLITDAIAQSAEKLTADYMSKINALTERIDALEGRIDDIESKLEAIMNRIQSLVYVPKTADGKIHIGSTYIAETDENGEDIGARIELTPTRKLEYRVSPADLRDKLLDLYESDPEAITFYQEHVTRAEGSGMDEFHITKIEEGNGPGELLITVNNEHDFTHEDLAIALCIKGSLEGGVTTEFTSPYTTVISDGRNLRDRFYLAKKFDGEWIVSRDDNIPYLLPYNETTPVSLTRGEYYLVYDNGESVMTIDEAKERFEWETGLTVTSKAINNAFSISGFASNSYTLTPSNPNFQRDRSVTFMLNESNDSNIRAKVTDKYAIYVSNGTDTIKIIPEATVSIIVIGTSYFVDSADVYWNFSSWYAGIKNGNPRYESSFADIVSGASISDTQDLSHYPEKDFNEIFAKGAEWTATANNDIQGDITVTSNDVQYDGNSRKIKFTVNGYLYNEGTQSIDLTRSVRSAHMVGTNGIQISSSINFHGLEPKTANIQQSAASTDSNLFLFYFTLVDSVTAEKKLTYTESEIATYFGGSKSNVSIFLTYGELNAKTPWTSADGAYSMPVESISARTEETGSAYISDLIVAHPNRISPALQQTTVFNAPDNYYWVIPNGPSIPITGTVTVTK